MAPARKEPLTANDARAMALRYLARRDYAERELARKLGQRGADAEVAGQVVTALREEGLLDDARFAEGLCRQKFAAGYGEQRLRAELRQRGVDEAVADQAIRAYHGEWDEAVLSFLRRRARDLEDEKERARLYRAGLRRGFAHDQVLRALDRLRGERAV